MAKCIEDAFRALGILKDDDPAHVARSIIEVIAKPRAHVQGQKKKDRKVGQKEDVVEITINSIEPLWINQQRQNS